MEVCCVRTTAQPDKNIRVGHSFNDGPNLGEILFKQGWVHARRKCPFFHAADQILRYAREADQSVDCQRRTR